MPIFLGYADFNASDAKQNIFLNKANALIQQQTHQQLSTIQNDWWCVTSALKNHETQEEQVLPLLNLQGMAIGRFYSDEKNAQALITRNDSKIQQSHGEWLVKNSWGKHVLIYADNHSKILTLYRDALGLASLYYLKTSNGIIFSSDIALLIKVSEGAKKFDWEYFSSYVACGDFHTTKTPFSQIKELLPGCCLNGSTNKISIEPFWQPEISGAIPENKEIATVFNHCVKQWLNNSNHACLQLSGGLDSSALFMAMQKIKHSQQEWQFVNFINSQAASSNELSHVKKLLAPFDYPLTVHEHYFSANPDASVQWNKPAVAILSLKSLSNINTEVNFVSGHGGDHLFLADVNSLFLADYFLTCGIKGFLKKLKAYSLFNRASSLVYVNKTIRSLWEYVFKNNLNPLAFVAQKSEWFSHELIENINTHHFLPPFWQKLSKVYPGKAFHLLSTYHASASVQFELSNATHVFPFLSQPLVELALVFPAFISFDGTGSRMHFRKAIGDYYATDLVWRQSKGEASIICMNLIKNNLKRVQELCLEGQFAQHHLIHKNLLNKHLHLLANGYVDEQWPLLRLISSELWFEALDY